MLESRAKRVGTLADAPTARDLGFAIGSVMATGRRQDDQWGDEACLDLSAELTRVMEEGSLPCELIGD